MKIEFRFLLLTASILLGCFVGLSYFNHGDFYSTGSRLEENESPYLSEFDRERTTERSLKDEIHQQLASTRTLYEFTATSEQKKTEPPAQRDEHEQSVQDQTIPDQSALEQPAQNQIAQEEPTQNQIAQDQIAQEELTQNQIAKEQSVPGQVTQEEPVQNQIAQEHVAQAQSSPETHAASELASLEADSEKMGEVLSKLAQSSPELTDSLNALNEARKAPADQLMQKTAAPQEVTYSNPKALIDVREYTQVTPILDVNPVEDVVEFHVQNAAEAQKSLSQELLAQNQISVPVQAPAQDPVQNPAQNPVQNPALSPALNPAPAADPVLAQGTIPIQTSVPVGTPTLAQGTTPIQTSAPTETPELVQTSALVPTSAPIASSARPSPLPAPTAAQAPASAPAQLSAMEIPENMEQNPLATIMGLVPSGKADQNETSGQSAEKPGEAAGAPAETSAQTPKETPKETSFEIPGETTSETSSASPANQLAENPFNHHPMRIKKPDRSPAEAHEAKEEAKETGAPIQKDEYSLDLYRVNLRQALASFQLETGLKVVASLDVQGTVSCKSKNSDPEVLLSSLLADTQFKFVRSGNFVYIAPSSQLTNLPTPLEKTETQFFTPTYISLEELELVFRSNLTQFGTCEVARNPSGQKGLSVTDWALSLDQLEKIQQIVDVPAPEDQMKAFVFQRELDGTFKALELLELAESQGLVLQRVAPLRTESREEKKAIFPGTKKEKQSEIQAYTISYRADSFMASVRHQLKTQPAPMQGQTSTPLELDRPMRFDFNLNVQDRLVPYQITVTYRQDPQNPGGINAEVVCEPRQDLGTKSKANDFHFTLSIPSQSRNSLILQLDLGEFPVENSGARKDISYAMRGNRMKKEVVVFLTPFQNVPPIPKNGLSAEAVREIIRQQEVLARKFYGSLNQGERENSKSCFGIAQRLRLSLGETGTQSLGTDLE